MQKVALVTGSTNNIGKAIAEVLAGTGFHVIVTSRHEEEARTVSEKLPPEYFEELMVLFSGQAKGAIFFAEYGGTRVATALVLYFGEIATYFFGGSLDIHRNTMAPYALQFEIMRKAKSLGYKWYDLWGVAPCAAPDDPSQNLSAFKRKFDGLDISFVPALDHIYDQAAYEEYVRRAGDSL